MLKTLRIVFVLFWINLNELVLCLLYARHLAKVLLYWNQKAVGSNVVVSNERVMAKETKN